MCFRRHVSREIAAPPSFVKTPSGPGGGLEPHRDRPHQGRRRSDARRDARRDGPGLRRRHARRRDLPAGGRLLRRRPTIGLPTVSTGSSAARKIGRETIEAEIKDGSARDAILHGIGANASHGLRRTQADKQRAVERLLKDPEWARWSDRKIAEVAKVDHKTVGKIRRDLSGEFPTGKSLAWGNPQADWQAERVGLGPRKRPRLAVGRGSDRRMPQARIGGGRCLTTTRSRRSPRASSSR